MHDKFTERVRKVIYLAREEAARLQHDYIGTEHLLLGVIREGEGIAATVLNNLGLDLDRIRQEVENMVSASGGTMTIGEIPFTPRAKRVLELAVEEARALGHNYVGTEHLLLGLLREGEGVAAQVLGSFDITLERVRAQVARIVGRGEEATSGQVPFTPRVKTVLELALREALSLGHNFIGTEHILLGLVRENEGVAARILVDFHADAEQVRDEVLRA